MGLLGLLLVGAGVYFTVRLRGAQFRHAGALIEALRHSFRPGHPDGVPSFRVFAVGLGGRVGAGDIVGVAIANTLGGPGAVLWMWAVALFGMCTAVVENTLGHANRLSTTVEAAFGVPTTVSGISVTVVAVLAIFGRAPPDHVVRRDRRISEGDDLSAGGCVRGGAQARPSARRVGRHRAGRVRPARGSGRRREIRGIAGDDPRIPSGSP